MDRLTYDFPFNGGHCWQIHGADNLECREVCERQGENGCIECPIAKAFDRLATYENTGLEPEEIESLCDMDRRAKIAEMLRIEEYFGVSIGRLRGLVEAERDGRCVVVTRCCDCGHHVEVNGYHQCTFWRTYCPNDSEFYCKAAKRK